MTRALSIAALLALPLSAHAMGGLRLGRGLGISQQEPQWTPRRLAPSLWLRAHVDNVTLNGATVSAWADRSANGWNATQAVAGNQPAWVADDGDGRPAIDCAGNVWLALSGAGLGLAQNTGALSVYVLTRAPAVPAGYWLMYISKNALAVSSRLLLSRGYGGSAYEELGRRTDADASAWKGGGVAATGWQRMGVLMDWTNQLVDVRVGASAVYSGTNGLSAGSTDNTASAMISIGGHSLNLAPGGFIREMIAFQRIITAREITLLEAHLRVPGGGT